MKCYATPYTITYKKPKEIGQMMEPGVAFMKEMDSTIYSHFHYGVVIT